MTRRLNSFSDEEMQTIWAGVAANKKAEQIAQSLNGIHVNTLQRRLLKYHGLLLENVLVSRLTPVGASAAMPTLEDRAPAPVAVA